MLRNYLKTALRNLIREKTSTTINIAGLTLGITCSLVLFLLIRHMSSFDTYHTNRDRIFRVVHESDGNQDRNYTPGAPAVLPDAFRIDFPEAREVVFTSYRAGAMVTIPQPTGEPKKYAEESGVVFTQSNFFRVFDRPILMGDPTHGLDNPNEAIISKRCALKYFGKADALGELIQFDKKEYKVTAVMDDYPNNTDFPFDLMLSYVTIKKESEENGWHSIWSDEQCYFLLKQEESIEKVKSRMAAFTNKYVGDDNPDHELFTIQPLSEIHFDSHYGTYSYHTVNRGLLIAFGVIAFILIVTACINFINLSTAEAIKRSREVGIRKVLGSSRRQLIGQFLGETTLISIMAMVISLATSQLAITFLNPFLQVDLSLNFANDGMLWIFIIAVTLIVSSLSGLYPAFVVSGYNPALALKNLISNRNSSGYNLRRALVVTQFLISQFFIISTIVVIRQLDYFQKKDLGFKKDAIVVVSIPQSETPNEGDGISKMRTLREELLHVPGVLAASLNSTPPSSGSVSHTNFKIEGNDETLGTQVKQVDGNYVDLFALELLAGENIKDLDTAVGFLVNEKFAHVAGMDKPDALIGKVVKVWGKEFPVVGVVKDFHTVSLRNPIEATLMMNRMRGYENLAVQLNPNDMTSTIEKLKSKWEATYPEYIFEYHFLDQQIQEFYDDERKMSALFGIFSGIAILIGCLGLFGLASYMANQKTKEIGVRKVLGASVESIILLFSSEYAKLIFLGFAFSAPLAWFVMNKFLDEFAYKITIGPTVFILGLTSTLAIALLTVGYKSFKSAVVNPATSLRSE